MFCSICEKKFKSPNSYYRHRTWNRVHLLLETVLLYEAEIKELKMKISPQIRNQPFLG